MRRHVIIGRFGPDDKTRVPKARDEVASTLQLVAGKRLDHGISRALADLKALHLTPSEIGADMLVVAAHVHAADTRSPAQQNRRMPGRARSVWSSP